MAVGLFQRAQVLCILIRLDVVIVAAQLVSQNCSHPSVLHSFVMSDIRLAREALYLFALPVGC